MCSSINTAGKNSPQGGKCPQPLVAIGDISVDKSLPKPQRIDDFVRQVRNPYHFRSGAFNITARFAKDGPSLEDCLQRMIA